MADIESESSGSGGLSSLAKTKRGKTTLIVVGIVLLYLVYRYWHNSTASAATVAPNSTGYAQDGTSGTSGGSATTGGTDTTGTSGGSINSNLTPNEQLSQWFSEIEGKAVQGNPNNAALIDATLGDLQNNVPLTQQEQQTWQSILSQYGAPPFSVGGQQDLYTKPGAQQYVYASAVDKQILLNAGVPASQLVPYGSQNIDPNALYVGLAGTMANNAGMDVQTLIGDTRVQTQQLVDNLLGVSSGGNSIAANGSNPTGTLSFPSGAPNGLPNNRENSGPVVLPTPSGGSVPQSTARFNPNAVPQKIGGGYIDPNAAPEGFSHLPSFNGLAPGTPLYYEPSPGNYVHISNPAALQKLPAGTPIYTKNG